MTVRRRRPRLFASSAELPRARRATDGVMVVVAATGLAAVSVVAVPPPGLARAVEAFLAAWPPFLDGLWQVLADLLVLLALGVLVAATVQRRWPLVRDLVLAGLVALGLSLAVGRLVVGGWPDLWEVVRRAGPPPWFPAARLALPAAVLMTAAPHLTLPARRLGRRTLTLAALGTMVLGAATPLGAVGAVLVAALAAGAVHLVFGSAAGRPSLDEVGDALTELGVPVRRLGVASRQQHGVFTIDAEHQDGRPLRVKVYGRDAHDAALLATLWRTVWYREPGAPLRLGRLQQVEHEALLTLLAGQAGVPTEEVVTAGATVDDDALLVLGRRSRPLPPGSPRFGAEVWAMLDRLHGAGIAHGRVDRISLTEIDGRLALGDFRGATTAPSLLQQRTDEVQALVTGVLELGTRPALDAAAEALGADRLAGLLPYLQTSLLTPAQRAQVRSAGLDLDDLRADLAARLDRDAPPLQELRRISVGSALKVLLPALALVGLVSAASGLDWERFRTELAGARWWLVAVGFLLTQVPRLTQAASTLGASPAPLPLGPVYGLQLATSYINLAVPSTAARVAMNIRFFQRHGVPPGAALAAGALDGFTGFLVQAGLLGGLLLLTPASLELNLDLGLAGAKRTVLLVLLLLVGVVGTAVAAVPRWRTAVAGWARQVVREGLAALRVVRAPRQLALLVGGNLGTEVLFAASLGVFARAFGFPVGLADLLVINIAVALLGGLLPVPGGIGVVEGGLTLGLIGAGMPEEAAFAAVMLSRLSSFYLPPLWGWFAMRWLERNGHL